MDSVLKKLNIVNFDGDKESVNIKVTDDRNEYCKSENYWIRNSRKPNVSPIDINNYYTTDEVKILVENEIKNSKLNIPDIEIENFNWNTVVIVSNGYGFYNNHQNIFDNIKISQKKVVLAVNNSLRFWESHKIPQYFLINQLNPPTNLKYLPILIASKRCNHEYIKKYRNMKYFYTNTPSYLFSSPAVKETTFFIDDYRNPICAAINCAVYFGAKRIFLSFCSEGYDSYKEGMERLNESAFIYPQQKLANDIVNKNIFWHKIYDNQIEFFYTGIKKSFSFAKYLEHEDFLSVINDEKK